MKRHDKQWLITLGLVTAGWTVSPLGTAAGESFPAAEHNLRLKAPIQTWDEAVPLGNGLLGGLLWGEDGRLRLSLDRGDLWDERPATKVDWSRYTWATLLELTAAGRHQEVNAIFDASYNEPHPTKLPAGRLEIDLGADRRLARFELNLATAEGRGFLADGSVIEAFYSATEPVALLRLPGAAPAAMALIPSGATRQEGGPGPSSGGAVAALGYPPARHGQQDGVRWFEQEAADGLRYVAAVGERRLEEATLLAVTITATTDDPDPVALAQQRVRAALDAGWAKLRTPHVAWWRGFWAESSLTVPEPHILNHYYLVRYFYGAASRRGAPPMPLQGVWTADSGSLPPWKGDYHNDLNTQMTYMAYFAAGHFDEGASFIDYLWERLPRWRRFAREFYGLKEGAATPGVMTLAGEPLGGWPMYSLSPTMSAWCAHLFYLHWRYTMDDAFLRERAWPWCREVGIFSRAMLREGADGVWVLERSSSPEVFDNTPRAWLEPNSNYDLMSLRMLFLALSEMADALGKSAEADTWRTWSDRLGPWHVREDGTLKLCAREDLTSSHRHLSNLMGLHPFNLITIEGGPADRQIIKASLLEWERLGTRGWVGYSFSWMAALRARVGDAEAALRHLDVFTRAFILRNGFHVNGDQLRAGFSEFTYRPFTLEGNFLGMHALQEMLLQSWSPTPGTRDTEVIRIFPATPWRWHDASFRDLRTEGGHLVSARRRNNATQWFALTAGRDGMIRIRDNFAGRVPQWNRLGVHKDDQLFVVRLRRGQTIEARFDVPDQPPSPPPDLAEPVVTTSP
jgi:alpha-L-fucosidase 2